MSTLLEVVLLIVAISVLIIMHEIGHFLASRLFKIEVEEFGIGFPPRAKKMWRGRGFFKLGSTRINTPLGRRALDDLEPGTWVDALTTRNADGAYTLNEMRVLDPSYDTLEPKREQVDDKVRIRGEVTEEKLGTIYSLNWLPLGGFVRPKGEEDLESPDGLMAANPWVRIGVYVAGPAMNLLIGVLLYTILIMQVGKPIPDQVIVSGVAENSPAAEVGLLTNDLVLEINDVVVDSTMALRDEIYANLGEPIAIVYERNGVVDTVSLVPRPLDEIPAGEGAIGIQMSNIYEPIQWWEALPEGAVATYQHSLLLLSLPTQVFQGDVPVEAARPVGYVGMWSLFQRFMQMEPPSGAGPSFYVIYFFVMITISLGIFNLLPIPALDGGRILFALPEIVLRRRIPIQWQYWINFLSFVALILLFFYINILDFTSPVELPQ